MQKLNNSRISIIIFIGAVIILGIYNFTSPKTSEVSEGDGDVKNISYVLDGETFTLVDGKISVETTLDSESKRTIMIFGEPIYGDLNGDGAEDAAVLLTSSGEGSGTFYYAALAIATGTTYTSTNALLLGDRIAPQNIEIHEGRAVYNYAERNVGEPMTTLPSVGKSLWIHYDAKNGEIGEFVKNFEGEVDASRMTLGMKKWEWIRTDTSSGTAMTPNKAGVFTLTFTTDGKVAIGTDCNQANGSYTRSQGNILSFGPIMSTKMFCDGSQEGEFLGKLPETTSYFFTTRGDLVLRLGNNAGTMRFK